MPYLDGAMLWSFRGVQFAARLQSLADWDEWFDETTIAQIDPILDSQDRYVDVAGVNYSSLQRLIAFNTLADREAFNAMRGSTGVLSRPGASAEVLFTRAKRVSSGTDAYFLLDVTFDHL